MYEIIYNYSEFAIIPDVTTQRYAAYVIRIGEIGGPVTIYVMEIDFSGTTITYVAGRRVDYLR